MRDQDYPESSPPSPCPFPARKRGAAPRQAALQPAACLALFAALFAATPARADACDRLTARVIRVTGASLAGRTGPLAVFRALDAERMSLDCRMPRRLVFASLDREPPRPFFTLIGRGARALGGASTEEGEVLALSLHQASLLSGAPREGRIAGAALRCETGPRGDGLAGTLTVCVLVPDRGLPALRRAG